MKIFRKIRFELLGENKTKHYLLYAAGEIVLVVIGILIALQIDNWNQVRKDDNALKEYLVKIKSHTKEDLKKLEEISKGRAQISGYCKQARNSILNKTEDENLELFMASGYAFADYYFKPNTGGYEALKNSEYFGKINNTPLDSLLTQYHYLLDAIAENEKSYNDYMVNQESYISTQIDISLVLAKTFVPQDVLNGMATSPVEFDDAFRQYTGSAPYRNVISLAAFQFDSMIYQYNKLGVLGQSVIEEIDAITNK
ncbi:DUF6090 family protein [Maribacter sp. R77961]|uniref:DUF6090 family protein n=1 Tax=Maribacter sp. R77961 TaxID=3093871 RepID=UPI0037C83FD4